MTTKTLGRTVTIEPQVLRGMEDELVDEPTPARELQSLVNALVVIAGHLDRIATRLEVPTEAEVEAARNGVEP